MVCFFFEICGKKRHFLPGKKTVVKMENGTCEHVSLKRGFVQLSRQNLNTRPKKRYRQVVLSNKFVFSPGTCRDDEI